MDKWDEVVSVFAASADRAAKGPSVPMSVGGYGPHQIVDSTRYPHNPSCVFPPGRR